MNVLIDTNIVIDALASRAPFDKAAQEIILLAVAKRITAAITASTATDIYYLTHKYLHSADETSRILKRLFALVEVISVDKIDCIEAFYTGIPDYEDSLLAVCAKRWQADFIITRNTQDFTNSSVPVLMPQFFLDQLSQYW
jgi:predicted nucleic acid-binding protein